MRSNSSKQFAEILVNRNNIFTYEVPEALKVQVGHEVEVPLGTKTVRGFVLKFVSQPTFPTKDILEIHSPVPFFTKDLVKLAEWMAKHYQCFLASALKAILPK